MSDHDLVIAGGRVIDPAGGIEHTFNIGIRDGKIRTLSQDALTGQTEIRADGLVVSPGFIDVHNHVDGLEQAGLCMAGMGVTTVIGGNCGMAMTPDARDVGAFLDRIDGKGFPVNHGLLVGCQDLRRAAGVPSPHAAADDGQLFRMLQAAEEALALGALGISFGLALAPGIAGREVLELFRIAARHDVPAAVHPRFFGPGVPGLARDALAGEEELIDAAEVSGARLQISHLASQLAWKSRPYDRLMRRGLEIIEEARDHGIDVMADSYPYSAWCMYPEGALLDGLFLPAVKHHLGVDLSMVEIGSGPYKGERLNEALYRRIKQEAPKTLLVGHMMRQDLVDRVFLSPSVMAASDGVYDGDTGLPSHPRGAGTFARILSRLVRETGMLSLEDALARMTWLPAQRFGLRHKGRIAVGMDADVVIFDPDTIQDLATYAEPAQGVSGMEYVIVAGQPVVEKGRPTGAGPGRAVRRGGAA